MRRRSRGTKRWTTTARSCSCTSSTYRRSTAPKRPWCYRRDTTHRSGSSGTPEQAHAHVEDLADRLRKDGVRTTAQLRIGKPSEEIVQFLEEQRAAGHPFDVVVMGTHGRTGLRHLFAGSVTERVVRVSPIPVMTIRHPD